MKFLKFFTHYLTVKIWFFKEQKKVAQKFYKNRQFYQIDKALQKAYFFKNPYHMNNQFLKKKGNSPLHVYGETPLTTMELIVKECSIKSTDTVFDLGSGRGRVSFFLREIIGCTVYSIEWMNSFVDIANKILNQFHLSYISFSCMDFFTADFSVATVIYLYGTCLNDPQILTLLQSFLKLPRDTKIITISYSLQEYSQDYVVLKKFKGSYPWGEADIFLNTRGLNENSNDWTRNL